MADDGDARGERDGRKDVEVKMAAKAAAKKQQQQKQHFKYETREEWLRAAIAAVRPIFTDTTLPAIVHVSCGFPSVRALSNRNRSIGECWYRDASSDGNHHIFISPTISHDEPVKVLETLVHELVHAAVGHECGHKGAFKQTAQAVGLEGRMTATHAGQRLLDQLTPIAKALGPYPHATLNPLKRPTKKQGTRMLKLECAKDGYIVRTTRKWMEEMGAPTCPCGRVFVEADADGEEEN